MFRFPGGALWGSFVSPGCTKADPWLALEIILMGSMGSSGNALQSNHKKIANGIRMQQCGFQHEIPLPADSWWYVIIKQTC